MFRKLEEMQTNLNSHILEAFNTVIERKVLPSIKNAVKTQNSAKNTNLDIRSDELHPFNFSQVHPQKDLQSDRLHPIKDSHVALDAQNHFPRLVTMRCDRINHCRENSVESHHSDEENGDDMVIGANFTPQMVPEFPTERPMQSRNKIPHQQGITCDTLDKLFPHSKYQRIRTLKTQTQNLQETPLAVLQTSSWV